MSITRLRTTIGAGKIQPLTFDFTADLVGDQVVSAPMLRQLAQEGSVGLTMSTPTISSDGKKVSTSITCPESAVAGRWDVTCSVSVGPYRYDVSATIIQS